MGEGCRTCTKEEIRAVDKVSQEEVRVYLLRCAEAFAGRRGRSGVVNFLLGQASPSTLSLAAQQGVSNLFAILKDAEQQELLQSFNALQQLGMLELRHVSLGDKSLPLVFVTSRGLAELELHRAKLPVPMTIEQRATDNMLLVLQRIGMLIKALRQVTGEELPAVVGLTREQLQHYLELLCKALHLRPETVLLSPGSQQHFADALEKGLSALIFGELREVEAQCLRLHVDLSMPHQLDKSKLLHYYGVVSIDEQARKAAARLVAREWQAKCQLVSVLSFLALAEGLNARREVRSGI